jgi:hypothetical protein
MRLSGFQTITLSTTNENYVEKVQASLGLLLNPAILNLGDHQRSNLFTHFVMNVLQNFNSNVTDSRYFMALVLLLFSEYLYFLHL